MGVISQLERYVIEPDGIPEFRVDGLHRIDDDGSDVRFALYVNSRSGAEREIRLYVVAPLSAFPSALSQMLSVLWKRAH